MSRAEKMLAKLREASSKGRKRQEKRSLQDDWLHELRRMHTEETVLSKDIVKSLARWAETAAEYESRAARSGLDLKPTSRIAEDTAAAAGGDRDDADSLCPLPAHEPLGARASVSMLRNWQQWHRDQARVRHSVISSLETEAAVALQLVQSMTGPHDAAAVAPSEVLVVASCAVSEQREAIEAEAEALRRAAEQEQAMLLRGAGRLCCDELQLDSSAAEPDGALLRVAGTVAARALDARSRVALRSLRAAVEGVLCASPAAVVAILARQRRSDRSAPPDAAVAASTAATLAAGTGTGTGAASATLPGSRELSDSEWADASLARLLPSGESVGRLLRAVCEAAGGSAECWSPQPGAEAASRALLALARRDVGAELEGWAAWCRASGLCPAEPHGGVGAAAHSAVARVRRAAASRRTDGTAASAASVSVSVSAVVRRCAAEVPGVAEAAVARCVRWLQRREAVGLAVAARLRTLAAELCGQMQQAGRAAAEAAEAAAEAGRAAAEAGAREGEKRARVRALAAAQQRRVRSLARVRQAEAEAAAEAAMEAALRSERETGRREEASEALRRWRARAEALRARQAAAEAAEAEAAEEAEAGGRAAREERVAERREQLEAKRLRREQLRLETEAACTARASALEELKRALPYAEALAGMERDAARLESHTTSTAMAAAIGNAHAAFLKAGGGALRAVPIDTGADEALGGVGGDEERAAHRARLERLVAERGLYSQHGFTAKHVRSDLRSKLLSALGGAGLAGSAYAGQMMHKLAAPVPRVMQPTHNWGEA